MPTSGRLPPPLPINQRLLLDYEAWHQRASDLIHDTALKGDASHVPAILSQPIRMKSHHLMLGYKGTGPVQIAYKPPKCV